MVAANEESAGAFVMACLHCGRRLTAQRAWAGREVRCPHCARVFRIPPAPGTDRPVRAPFPSLEPRVRFHFGCPRCQSLLEAHAGMCGEPACCPTCGARVVVPALNPRTHMPDRAALLDSDDQYPTPMHAYAADGHRAPRLERLSDGTMIIRCPRCGARCAVDADACAACGAPFTIEGAPTATGSSDDSRAVAALVLGFISLPLCKLLVPAAVAVVLGVMSLHVGSDRKASGVGIVGLILGIVALAAGVALWLL